MIIKNLEASDMIRNDIRKHHNYLSGRYRHALKMGADALEKVDKITDLVEGTIDHFDRDDALDLLYQIKHVIEAKEWGAV